MRFVLTLLGAAFFSTSALAAGYFESKKGDLSNDGLNPTPVKLQVGNSTIDGADGRHSGMVDRDYFTIRILTGQRLESITLDPKTKVGDDVSFIGVQRGKQVTLDPDGHDASDLLGWVHVGTADEAQGHRRIAAGPLVH